MIQILTHNLAAKTTIPKVISAERSERLTGENTLRFSTLLKEVTAALIAVGDVAFVDNEYYDIVSVTKEQASDGLRKIAVECEHVSYRLNEIEVDFFTQIGTPTSIMSEILAGTGFTLVTCEFSAIETFSLQEKSSKRGLVQAYAAYIGAEVAYSQFTVSLVHHRGQSTAVQLKSGRDILVLKEIKNTDGVSYDCDVLKPQAFNLGDNVIVDYPSMGITASLRVNGITRNPYDDRQVSVEIANAPNLLEGDFCRIKTDMVAKGSKYFGIRISAANGFEVERNDGLSKATFNSDVFEMSSLVDGVMTPAIYFDAVERRYKIAGIVDVDGEIITNAITAEIANIANAVIEHLEVGDMVADEIIAQIATIVQLVAEQIDVQQLVAEQIEAQKADIAELVAVQIDVENLIAQAIEANTANIVNAVIENLTAENADVVNLNVTELTTNGSDHLHIYEENIDFLMSGGALKARIGFADINGGKIPVIELGYGDGTGGSRGIIYKDADSLRLGYIASGGGTGAFVDIGEQGIMLNADGAVHLLDIANGLNGQVLKKQDNTIVWADTGAGDWGNANLIILDHTPTETDVEGANENALFVVYDINDTVARWGSSAFDTAKEQGYSGTKDEYNDALSQVGAIQNVLDAILGE
ncbi:hypothetical protein FACS189499_05800 [Clostridia bacterium]|nr:hypothetical protein FACS189499_05800 [Clostridia bacterium]